MERRILRASLFILLFATFLFAGEPLPQLGEIVPAQSLKLSEKQPHLCQTHSSQLDPCFAARFNGVEYHVAYDEKSKRVTYIDTHDKAFRTADGQTIGDEIPVSEKDVRAFPGWIVFGLPTSDGWRPILGEADVVVRLKNGGVLKLWGKSEGSSSGVATIIGFAKGPQRPKQ